MKGGAHMQGATAGTAAKEMMSSGTGNAAGQQSGTPATTGKPVSNQ